MSSSEVVAAVKALAQDFQHLSRRECFQTVAQLLERCNKQGADMSPEDCKAVLTFVLTLAAPRCTGQQRPLQWSCLALVACAGRAARANATPAHRVDLHGFFFRLAKKEAKAQPVWKPAVLILMLQYVVRWIQVGDLAGASQLEGEGGPFKFDVVTSLMEALYGEMNKGGLRWTPRWRLKATRALRRVLAVCPQVLDHAVAWAKKSEDPPAILTAAIMLEVAAAKPPSAHRASLVELYTKQVLEAKQPLPDSTLEAWAPLLGTVTPEELEKQLLPLALRMFKRQPAAMAQSFPFMVAHLKTDLSPHAKEILDPLALDLLKERDKRPKGRRIIQEAVRGCSDASAPAAVAEGWAEALKKATKTDEKQAILMALTALLAALPVASGGAAPEGLQRLADPKGGIAKVAGDDATEETRALGYTALGALALRLPAASREAVAQELVKPLVDKKAVDRPRLAALESLAVLAEQVAKVPEQGAPAWVPKLLDAAVPVVTLAATKPVQRFQSLLAWAVCGSLAATQDDGLASKLKKEQLAVIKEGSSFLNVAGTVLKAPRAELDAQVTLWRSVLRGGIAGLPPFGAASSALLEKGGALSMPPNAFADVPVVCRTALILHALLWESALQRPASDKGEAPASERPQAPSKRLGLVDAVTSLPEAEADALLLLLVQGLVAWLAELAGEQRGKKPQVSGAALRGILEDLCVATATSRAPPRPETLALLAATAHHPLLISRRRPSGQLWRRLCSKAQLAASLHRGGPGVWRAVRQLLASARKLPAGDRSGFRAACAAAAGALNTSVPEDEAALQEDVKLLIAECAEALHKEEVGKEKAWNVEVFFAPEGRLYREEGTYVAEEREDKNIKKNKYLKDLYGDDELVVEKRAAPSAPAGKSGAKAKAKAKSVGEMTASDIEAARVAEQAETRARIRTYVDEATFALDVLTVLTRAKVLAPVLEEALPSLVSHFLVLLKSPLTVLQAQQCLRAIVGCVLSKDVLPRGDLLPEALTIAEKGWLQRSPSACGTRGSTPVAEAVLNSATVKQAMPEAALALFLPLILRVLRDSCLPLQTVCGRALELLERQLVLGAEVPQGHVSEVFDALSIALLTLPAQRSMTQAAMLATAKHLVSTEDELRRLADMFFADEELVRGAVIAALSEARNNAHVEDGTVNPMAARAVLRLGALDEKTEALARETLEAFEFEADEDLVMELIGFTKRGATLGADVQQLIAKAVAEALTELSDPDVTNKALDELKCLFLEDAAPRITVGRCLERVFAGSLQGEQLVVKAFRFLLQQGLALTSSSTPETAELRDVLLAAGTALIENHGEAYADVLYRTMEKFDDSAAGAAAGESVRLGVAVFLGALSKHLPPDHEKVSEILPRLLQRLLDPTSSASVQDAIVKVMPPLLKHNKEQAAETLEQLMAIALAPKTEKIPRRGAAMGLGATVKGLSIQAVSQYNVLTQIKEATGSKDTGVREGALLCLEGLTLNLGRLFDPYVVTSLPLLLQAHSDPKREVQNCSQSAAKAMMSQLSGPGVKQVLKPLLEGIQDKQWKTKLGSIEILASMTNCLPKQLAACLPQVVPALCTVINDQHPKVKEAARDALDRVGSIITSPELKAIAPDLISALTDGAQFEHITKEVLDKLLGTSFVHHIDAPSLSLVCPLVQRALKERSAEMKRKGAQIVGSMVMLIRDAKDIQPYLPLLIPQLKLTLLDPIPDVRTTAAQAFGTLARGLPEEMLQDVLPWLLTTLQSPESTVERSGAAHGLSEVLMAMGTDRVKELLPDILNKASKSDEPQEVKEGYLGLFVYLPVAMGSAFEPYINEVLTSLLRAQADDATSVRDIALKAAQVITKKFGASHTELLLSPLEEGVFDEDWRIRHASVQLMGQLIEQILRAHRIPTQSAELMYCEMLPREWRTHMLASLYIVRSDENMVVKHASTQVWKTVVQNTPRVLKELLPALMQRLIASLASTNKEKQRVAARCVGDLVGKLGERVMPELMPIFMNTLESSDAHVREGVCIGLAELINATTKQLLADYVEELIPAIQKAIIDDVESVRLSASTVVALLHNTVGQKTTTDIVTFLLESLEVEEYGHMFLNGLEQLMTKQPAAVLPLVLSHLTREPENGWTPSQVRGLGCLAKVPDSHTVHRHLSDVIPVLVRVASSEDEDLREVALETAGRIMDRVEQGGIHLLFAELTGAVRDPNNARRRSSGAKLFEHFFERTNLDVVSVLSQVLPAVLPVALADEDPEALETGMRTLNSIVKKVKKEELAPYMSDVRNSVLALITNPVTRKVEVGKLLPGLCEHNGLEPLYPIYQHGLMYGTAEARELAAKGLGELVDHTSEAALKGYVVKITGPLIRIVGERYPGTVKKAIVDTLQSLLIRGGPTLKPFIPQLQTMYVKCLTDNTEAVRLKAAESLGILVRLAPRTEPLINELSNNVTSHADPQVRLAMGMALGEVLLNVPQPASDAAQEKLLEALLPRALDGEGDRQEREAAAWALGMVLRRHVPPQKALELLRDNVERALKDPQAAVRYGAAVTLGAACWCQGQQLPVPPEELLERIKDLSLAALTLSGDSDPEVLAGVGVLAVGASRLFTEANVPKTGKLAELERKYAGLVPPLASLQEGA